MPNNFKQTSARDAKMAEECVREEKSIREHLTEDQIDKVLKDSFPASDPPSWY